MLQCGVEYCMVVLGGAGWCIKYRIVVQGIVEWCKVLQGGAKYCRWVYGSIFISVAYSSYKTICLFKTTELNRLINCFTV